MKLDRRLNAYRPDLADARLRGLVEARRYVEGQFARVVVGEAPLRQSPDATSELDTFYHYGEPVLVFDTDGGFAWCQSLFDGYVGYVEAAHITTGDIPEPSHFVPTLGSYTYSEPDLRSPALDFLPRHSEVVVAETGLVTRGTEYARIDTGGYIPLGCLSAEPARSVDLVAATELYLGCPYRWAGRSIRGVDCSGLVQSAFRDLGETVPRDTDMQRDCIGEPVAARDIDELQRGDLIYLAGHVLIYAGNGGILHADGSSMMVRRDDLAPWLDHRNLELETLTVRRPL